MVPGATLKLAAKGRPVIVGRLAEVVPVSRAHQRNAPSDSVVRVRTDWGLREVPLSEVLWIEPSPHMSWTPIWLFFIGAVADFVVITSLIGEGLDSSLR